MKKKSLALVLYHRLNCGEPFTQRFNVWTTIQVLKVVSYSVVWVGCVEVFGGMYALIKNHFRCFWEVFDQK